MDSVHVVAEVMKDFRLMKLVAYVVVFYYYHLALAMLVVQQQRQLDSRVHRVLRGTKSLLAKPLIILYNINLPCE